MIDRDIMEFLGLKTHQKTMILHRLLDLNTLSDLKLRPVFDSAPERKLLGNKLQLSTNSK
jgi:hypothetical protein